MVRRLRASSPILAGAAGVLAMSGATLFTLDCALVSGLSDLQVVECRDACTDASPGMLVVDTGTADASGGPPFEAGADNGSPDASSPFCASLNPQPTLCADFDEGSDYATQFPQTTQPSAGHVGVDGSAFLSAPDSLFATIDANTSGQGALAYASHKFPGSSSSIRYSFDVMFEQYVAGQRAVVARVVLNPNQPNPHFVTVVLSSTSAEIEQFFTGSDGGTMFVDTPIGNAPPLNTWTRIELTVSLAQRSFTVILGGTVAVNNAPLDPSWATSGTLAVELGLTFVATTSSAWTARFDNVVAEPQ